MSCDLLSKDWERGVKVNTPVKSSKSPALIFFHKLNSKKQRGSLFWFLKDKTCYIKNDKYRMKNGYRWVHVTFQFYSAVKMTNPAENPKPKPAPSPKAHVEGMHIHSENSFKTKFPKIPGVNYDTQTRKTFWSRTSFWFFELREFLMLCHGTVPNRCHCYSRSIVLEDL